MRYRNEFLVWNGFGFIWGAFGYWCWVYRSCIISVQVNKGTHCIAGSEGQTQITGVRRCTTSFQLCKILIQAFPLNLTRIKTSCFYISTEVPNCYVNREILLTNSLSPLNPSSHYFSVNFFFFSFWLLVSPSSACTDPHHFDSTSSHFPVIIHLQVYCSQPVNLIITLLPE